MVMQAVRLPKVLVGKAVIFAGITTVMEGQRCMLVRLSGVEVSLFKGKTAERLLDVVKNTARCVAHVRKGQWVGQFLQIDVVGDPRLGKVAWLSLEGIKDSSALFRSAEEKAAAITFLQWCGENLIG